MTQLFSEYKNQSLFFTICTKARMHAMNWQTHQKLVARGWNRPRARDYYDLWCILKNYSTTVDTNRLIDMLDKKCKHRDVSFKNIDDFFTTELVKEANQHWQATLGVLVRELPECGNVLEETKLLIANFI